MEAKQKKVLWIIVALGALYFVAFIQPNLAGARDANMLMVFETDEYAQYPHILRMLTPGDTLYQTVRNFLIYLHYYYGYPFYFFSALAVLPVKLFGGEGWSEMTPLLMVIMRQMLSVLPALLSAGLLVYTQTHFRSTWKAVGLFVFLLIMPAVVGNNMFWHPDGLSLLTVVLTFFFLERDDQRFGRNFLLAGLACGLAISVKSQGFFFFLAVPLYLLWGFFGKRISLGRTAGMALAFVGLMIAAVLISNPLLFLPLERSEILNVQINNIQQLGRGFMVQTTEPYFVWGQYPEDFRYHYGELWFALLALLALGVGLAQPKRRLLNALILAWALPLMASINAAATRRTHYFLPVMLPVYSALVNFFPDRLPHPQEGTVRQKLLKVAPWIAGGLIVLQGVIFVTADAEMIRNQLNRENNSSSITFFNHLDQEYFSGIPVEDHVVIYRDWHVYVPPRPRWQIELNWDLATYDYINDIHPDVLLLEQANITLFSDPQALANASDPEKFQAWHDFYTSAAADTVPGYRRVYGDHFGVMLVKEDFYTQYWQ